MSTNPYQGLPLPRPGAYGSQGDLAWAPLAVRVGQQGDAAGAINARLDGIQSAIQGLAGLGGTSGKVGSDKAVSKLVAPIILHMQGHARTQADNTFAFKFRPPTDTLARSAVYLLEFCIQGAHLEYPSLVLSLSSLRTAMNVSFYSTREASDWHVDGSAMNKFVVTCNEIPNFRASRSYTYPARYLGQLTQTGLSSMDLTVEYYDHVTGLFKSPWVADDDLIKMPYSDSETGEETFKRLVDVTLLIVPPLEEGESALPAS